MTENVLLFMFHHGPLGPHVVTALRLLEKVQQAAGDAAPYFVFAGSIVPTAYKGQIEFVDTAFSQESWDFLDATYQHETMNARSWEIMAMWRWFVLADLLKRDAYTGPIVFFDSDVFAYDNPALILDRFVGDFGLSGTANPGISFYRTSEPIFAIRDLIFAGMKSAELRRHIIESIGSAIQSFGGGLQEMGYLNFFVRARETAGATVARVNEATKAGIYDYSINFDQPGCDPGFLCDDFGKVVIFRDNVPYFLSQDDAKPVRALCLHIHGSAKRYIGKWIPANFGDG